MLQRRCRLIIDWQRISWVLGLEAANLSSCKAFWWLCYSSLAEFSSQILARFLRYWVGCKGQTRTRGLRVTRIVFSVRHKQHTHMHTHPALLPTVYTGSPQGCIPVTLIQDTQHPTTPRPNNPHSSITYTHNQYRLSAVIDPGSVYTQLLSPDRGLLPGIKTLEKDTWSPAPGFPQPSPRRVKPGEIKAECRHQRLLLYLRKNESVFAWPSYLSHINDSLFVIWWSVFLSCNCKTIDWWGLTFQNIKENLSAIVFGW